MFDGILNIAGMEFTEVIPNPTVSIPALSIGFNGYVTANKVFIKTLGDTKRVRIFQTGGLKHIAVLPSDGERDLSFNVNAKSGKVGNKQLEKTVKESGIKLPADCQLTLDETTGVWYGKLIPREVHPKSKEAAKKPRKKNLGVILTEGGSLNGPHN